MWVTNVINAVIGLGNAIAKAVNDGKNRKQAWEIFNATVEADKQAFNDNYNAVVYASNIAVRDAKYKFDLALKTDQLTTQSTLENYTNDPNFATDCVTQYQLTGYIPPVCANNGLNEEEIKAAIEYKIASEEIESKNKLKYTVLALSLVVVFIAAVYYKEEVKKIF